MRASRHGPNRLASYQETNDTILRQLTVRGLICANELRWEAIAGEIVLIGELGCVGNIVVRVEKTLEITSGDGPNAEVQTIDYCYNASVRGAKAFLRYDNAHVHDGHETAHHRHAFDWRTEHDLPGSPSCQGNDWPTLGEFLEEVERWYWDNRESLPEPDACPVLMKRGA